MLRKPFSVLLLLPLTLCLAGCGNQTAQGSTELPNPYTTYEDANDLSEALGFEMVTISLTDDINQDTYTYIAGMDEESTAIGQMAGVYKENAVSVRMCAGEADHLAGYWGSSTLEGTVQPPSDQFSELSVYLFDDGEQTPVYYCEFTYTDPEDSTLYSMAVTEERGDMKSFSTVLSDVLSQLMK